MPGWRFSKELQFLQRQSAGDQAHVASEVWRQNSFCWGRSAFWSTLASTDWMRPTLIMEGNLHYSEFTGLNENFIQKHHHRNIQKSQFSLVTQLFLTVCDPMDSSTPGFPVYHQLLKFTQTHVHLVGDAIQASHPLLSPSPPAFNLSQHQGLCNESVLCIRWPKYWSFSFSICPSKEYSGLISFRIDWLALLAVQGSLKSLLQHHSSKASILQCSYPYMTHIHTWLLENP